MGIRAWRFITLLLAALALTMESAHVLELPQKMQYDTQMYSAVNTTGVSRDTEGAAAGSRSGRTHTSVSKERRYTAEAGAKLVLWLFVINLGIAFGAGLYESRIVIP
jgi:hypothetical protein